MDKGRYHDLRVITQEINREKDFKRRNKLKATRAKIVKQTKNPKLTELRRAMIVADEAGNDDKRNAIEKEMRRVQDGI